MIDSQSIDLLKYLIKMSQKKSKIASKVAFDPTVYEKAGVPRDEVEEIRQAFEMLDAKKAGLISSQDLKSAAQAYGLQSKNQSLWRSIEILTKKSTPVSFQTFLDVITAYRYNPKTRQSYKKIFSLFDDESTGWIGTSNLKSIVRDMNITIHDSDIQNMVDKADLDNDGLVSFDEFYQIMTHLAKK